MMYLSNTKFSKVIYLRNFYKKYFLDEKFIDFQENYLKKLNNKNNNPLAGFDPRDSNLENSYDVDIYIKKSFNFIFSL